MAKRELNRSDALKMLAQLMKNENDLGLAKIATKVDARLRKPMAEILKKVPGKNVKDKCERIGVSRQAYYSWLKGTYRPIGDQARRLARLTGVPLAYVEGKGDKPPKRRQKPSGEAAVA